MANIVVFVELAGGATAPASLETLGEGRRIATFLGATLYAALVSPATDGVIAELGEHGADRVILAAAEAGPLLWATHGPALAAVVERIPPTLVLLAATSGGRDIAPRLAARLAAAYVAEPSVEHGPRGDLVLSRKVYGGQFRRRLAAEDVERPIVATLTPGSYRPARGDDEAEVLRLALPSGAPLVIEELEKSDDAGAPLDSARIVVTAGAGLDASALPLCAALAARLGGQLGFTHDAVEKGLGPADREVGLGGRSVAPRLYIACGASGSAEHLLGVAADAQIVAINRDPQAAIFRVAHYGLVGEAAELLPELLAALGPRGAAP